MTAPDQKRLKVFVVDDEPISIDILTTVLQDAGHEVMSDLMGTTAISRIRQERPDVVLTDLQMASVDGFAICRELRRFPSLRRTKIIVVSAHSAETWRARAAEAGADGYAEKPIDADRLLGLIADIVARP
ncbi:MAG: response regulator [Rhodospirillales bacterium]